MEAKKKTENKQEKKLQATSYYLCSKIIKIFPILPGAFSKCIKTV